MLKILLLYLTWGYTTWQKTLGTIVLKSNHFEIPSGSGSDAGTQFKNSFLSVRAFEKFFKSICFIQIVKMFLVYGYRRVTLTQKVPFKLIHDMIKNLFVEQLNPHSLQFANCKNVEYEN